MASEPQAIITFKDSYNGYATVAGKVLSEEDQDVAVTVRCGNLKYTTMPDPDGNWGIVFRHTNLHFYVTAWDRTDPENQTQLEGRLK